MALIADAKVWRQSESRAQRAALPPSERGVMPRCCAAISPTSARRPYSWAPSPCRWAWSPPSSSDHCRHSLAPMRPPCSAGGPPPLRERFVCRAVAQGVLPPGLGALLRERHPLAAWHGEWPPSPTPECGANVTAGLSERCGPTLLRERFFAALLRGEFSAPAFALVYVGAISLPLGVENAVPSSSWWSIDKSVLLGQTCCRFFFFFWTSPRILLTLLNFRPPCTL